MIAVSNHAVHRYRRRHRMPRATVEDVAAVIEAGVFRATAPHGVDVALEHEDDCCGFVVNGAAVFPLREDPDGTWVAVTCLKTARRLKADRRAWREEQRALAAVS